MIIQSNNSQIAVCFFGQVKHFTKTLYHSFQNSIIEPLNNYNIDYFLVTYNNKIYYNPSSGEDHKINYESICNFFQFKQKIILDINAEYTHEIDNFVLHTLYKFGYDAIWGKNNILTTSYALRQIYGLHKLYEFINNTTYKKYIFCRPDCIFENKLDPIIINNLTNICIPNFNHWFGYNDRFAVVDKIGLKTYCSRYSEIRKNPTRYHSEKYLKSIIVKSDNSIHLFDKFQFRLLRANGELSRSDY